MECRVCNTELADDAAFCHKCGVSLKAADNPLAPEPRPESSQKPTPQERLKQKTNSNADDDDDDAEDELWEGRYCTKSLIGHWICYALVVILLVAVYIWLGITSWPVWLWSLLVVAIAWTCIWVYGQYLKWSGSYTLTNQRFIHRYGLLYRITDRLEVIDVDDIAFEQGLLQRIVGVGTLKITSSDRTHPELIVKGIDKVAEVADVMDAVRRKERISRGLHIESI